MRRRAPRLQISTFPFLAVLLCAMGSLILLLLVIDRRAKAVARQKAREAALAARADKTKLHDERKDEWERRRQELHDLLAGQQGELVAQVRSVEANQASAERQAQAEQAKLQVLQTWITQEKTKLESERAALEVRRAGFERAAGAAVLKDKKTRAEFDRLSRELAELEQTLQTLKTLRERQGHTYSLVPYAGQRGVARQPVYVECTAAGLTIQPRGRLVAIAELPSALAEFAEKDNPYMLLLVRPGGIEHYYVAQRTLTRLKIDYGYEFVDADWVLDFSDGSKASPPWRAVAAASTTGRAPVTSQPTLSAVPPRTPPMPGPGPRSADPPTAGLPSLAPGSATTGSAVPAPAPLTLLPPSGSGNNSGQGATNSAQKTGEPVPAGRDRPPPAENSGDKSPPALSGPLPLGPRQSAPPLSPLGRLIGNRNFLIIVECTADTVILHPGGQSFQTSTLPREPADHPLTQAVRQLIERRQATVRPGEPPYRPAIRFRIHGDGLRTYYRAFPLFEPLRLPMTREDVER